jgi:hypothetical protein
MADTLDAFVFGVCFIGFLLIVNVLILRKSYCTVSLLILLISSLLYGIWLIYAWYFVLTDKDTQSGLVFVIGTFGTVLLILPLWLLVLVLNHRVKVVKAQNKTNIP